jgi:hypothetical protein
MARRVPVKCEMSMNTFEARDLFAHAAWATSFSFVLALAHLAGVNSPI